ncbi:MAG: ADP-glyceromanno-heptose 6-epimerase [Candidatus Eremiobacteraeota bacterium]|nr:ADP-glyceromanno-heptose 6-epimerase [Candidatus Eremiobacteraeota bacterium]MCW5872205.1 ADP-glyceromanno-heptose 6-epimerase [Candidatus Eremiobacteraeota bacterium]
MDGRILVTGGAGLIGSAVIWFLNRQYRENILVADALDQSDKWKNLAALSFFDYLEGSELRGRLRNDSLGPISCVFHLGACSDTRERDSRYLMDNNYAFTRELAEWCLARGVRLVYASSAATYGDGSHGFSEKVGLHKLRPLNAYGYSKHLLDRHAEKQGWLDQLVGLKYFNVYGPNEQHKGDMRSVVSKAFEQIQSCGRVGLFKSYRPEYADGEQRRDFLYVKEAAEITVKLATSPACGLFNVGSGDTHTWNELAQAVFDALGQLPQVDFIDMPEGLRERYQYHTQADLRRLSGVGLDWQKFTLREGIFDYVRNYLIPEARLGDESF